MRRVTLDAAYITVGTDPQRRQWKRVSSAMCVGVPPMAQNAAVRHPAETMFMRRETGREAANEGRGGLVGMPRFEMRQRRIRGRCRGRCEACPVRGDQHMASRWFRKGEAGCSMQCRVKIADARRVLRWGKRGDRWQAHGVQRELRR